jgi:ribonuclease Y
MLPVFVLIALAVGGAAGFGVQKVVNKQKLTDADAKAKKLLDEARDNAKQIELEAKDKAIAIADEAKTEERDRRTKLDALEKRVADRETLLDSKLEQLEARSAKLNADEKEISAIKDELRAIRVKQEENLEKIAKLNKKQAEEKLYEMTERDLKHDLAEYIEKRKREASENADDIAKEIMAEAMERMATPTATERPISTVKIPDDEAKGRIIGKEGRNIQTIERLTGVDVIIDESPGVITLSGFDPIRRQVARRTIETLVSDGRIHPARIEEVVQKVQKEIDQEIKRAGEEAARDAKVPNTLISNRMVS